MSSEQRTLTAFPTTPDPEPATENAAPRTPRWKPQSKQDCQGCGGHVTPQFRKSMGDDGDVAHACRECVSANELLDGAAADPEYEPRVDPAAHGTGHIIGGGERR